MKRYEALQQVKILGDDMAAFASSINVDAAFAMPGADLKRLVEHFIKINEAFGKMLSEHDFQSPINCTEI